MSRITPAHVHRPQVFQGEYTALFASLYQPVPTFHRWRRGTDTDEDGVVRDFTACGLVATACDGNRYHEHVTFVPMRHALAFGKPCRRCFPEKP